MDGRDEATKHADAVADEVADDAGVSAVADENTCSASYSADEDNDAAADEDGRDESGYEAPIVIPRE